MQASKLHSSPIGNPGNN